MAQQNISVPAQPAVVRTPRTSEHDPLEVALSKAQANFTELYNLVAAAKGRDTYVVQMADANTPGVAYIPILRAGTITRISVIAGDVNGDAATVFTAAIAAVAVTHAALSLALDAVAGDVATVVPTAANTVAQGSNLNITTDGGGDTVMPVTISVEVTPT
jgi:hypothetical protein